MIEPDNKQPLEPPVKRSITIAGHRTSISLEQPFWDGLIEIANSQGVKLTPLITSIDKTPRNCGLSCALRIYVLSYYQQQSTDQA